MSYTTYKRLSDLHNLIGDLGKHGGLISPSIYNTAQVLRLTPELVYEQGVLHWLVANQQADGGWSNPLAPRMRDLPTLATVLALQPYTRKAFIRDVVEAGVAFLNQHAPQYWQDPLPDDIPVGIELLLPPLLDQAIQQGLNVPKHAYTALIRLGDHHREIIRRMRASAGSAPSYSWEGWGMTADPTMIDQTGGIGHSPAATATWLSLAKTQSGLEIHEAQVRNYLSQAKIATCMSNVGIMPSVWPFNRFEQIWSLYTVFLGGLLHEPYLQDVLHQQLDDLYQALSPTGIGMSDYFTPDGDDTAVALATLKATGYPVDKSVLAHFRQGDHFYSYPHELQPSLTTTAHAVLALSMFGEDVSRPVRYLIEKRAPDGRWIGDKWHTSWLYTSGEVVTALAYAKQFDAIVPAIDALLREQHGDGGWGIGGHSTTAETAYATLALYSVRSHPILFSRVQAAMERGRSWLTNYYDLSTLGDEEYWIHKELYCPYRINHAYTLSAIIALNMNREFVQEWAA